MLDVAGRRVLCLGDVMLDRFLYGGVDRISPEAPVPVVRLAETRLMPGGVGNVARNVAALGGETVVVGALGTDPAGDQLAALLTGTPGVVEACIRVPGRPTSAKTRVIAAHQHVLRLDEEVTSPLDAEAEAAVAAALDRWLPGAGALVVSDYAKGVLTDAVLQHALQAARRAGVPALVDPKRVDVAAYRGAALLKPNLRELAAATRLPVATEADVVAAARVMLERAEAAAVLVTRSERGMTLVPAQGAPVTVPAAAREVYDVSGAGDTVMAVAALALAAGHALPVAVRLANAAAGVVVGKLGTATLTRAELEAALRAEAAPGGEAQPATLEAAAAQVAAWRRAGLAVGFTNGCFDILHRGHVSLLRAARARCDRLVVALNEDASVRRLKGPERPVNPFEDRAAVIGALAAVDLVLGFAEDTPLEAIRRLTPDVLFKGADYTADQVVGGDLVRAAGGRVELLPLVPGRSTTGVVERLRGSTGATD